MIIISYIFFTLVIVGTFFAIVRIYLGPTAPDRLVGMSTMTTLTTVLLVFLGYFFNRYVYIDVALVYAVLSYIGEVSIARYLEGGI